MSNFAASASAVSRHTPRVPRVIAPKSSTAYIFGGIGSQWASMGSTLIYHNKTFRKTIVRLSKYLKEVDPANEVTELVKLFASKGECWTDKKYTGIGIVAYQIGVINILREDIRLPSPDYVIGHSIGETASGYASGAQTEKETILFQWVQAKMIEKIRPGQFILKTRRRIECLELMFQSSGFNHYYITDERDIDKFYSKNVVVDRKGTETADDTLYDMTGQMSVIGLEASVVTQAIEEVGLTQVCVGCENSPSGQTISGSQKEVAQLFEHLKTVGEAQFSFFYRKIDTDQIAYHSPFFSVFYDWLVAQNKNILGNRKGRPSFLNNKKGPRSWVSTSAKTYSSTLNFDEHYHAQTVVSPVRFQRAIEALPSGCLVVEVGSSSSLLGQVKRTRDDIDVLGLVKVGDAESESIYLEANKLRLKLWKAGYLGAFCSGDNNSPNTFTSEEKRLVETTYTLMKESLSEKFLERESTFTVEQVKRALQSCLRALKPREKIVMHSLRRAFASCACNPIGSVPQFVPLIKSLSTKDGIGKEASVVSRGMLLIFNGAYDNLENSQE